MSTITYEPLAELGRAITNFAKTLSKDVQSIYKDQVTYTASFPDGIPDVTQEAVRAEYRYNKHGWVKDFYINDEKIPSDTMIGSTAIAAISKHVKENSPYA
jgi:hypothetical protein